MFSGCDNRIKLKTNNIKITGKSPNAWKRNNILLNTLWIEKESQRRIFKHTWN